MNGRPLPGIGFTSVSAFSTIQRLCSLGTHTLVWEAGPDYMGFLYLFYFFQPESPHGDRRLWKVTQKMVLMSFKHLFQADHTFLELFSHCAYNNRRHQHQKAVHFDIPCNGKSQTSLCGYVSVVLFDQDRS